MRIDLFLKKCCLVKHRSLAKRACENGIVLVDGKRAKPSSTVSVGQIITVDFTDRYLEVEVISIPRGNVSRAEATQLYQVIKDEAKNPIDL